MSLLTRTSSSPFHRARPILLTFLIACSATLPRRSTAQSIPPIGIYFEDTTSTWPKADRAALKATVRPKLIAFVQKMLQFWAFVEVEEADSPDNPRFTLHFLITELQAGLVSVVVHLRDKDHQIETWEDKPFFSLAEKLSSPPPSSDKVLARFTALLMARDADIKKHLGMTPIAVAEGGQWLPLAGPTDAPRVVLPLPWKKYQDLRESLLHLSCATTTNESTILEARGGMQADYRPAPNTQPYSALVIIPVKGCLTSWAMLAATASPVAKERRNQAWRRLDEQAHPRDPVRVRVRGLRRHLPRGEGEHVVALDIEREIVLQNEGFAPGVRPGGDALLSSAEDDLGRRVAVRADRQGLEAAEL